jgi:hypothetical protein
MSDTVRELIASLTSMGGTTAAAHHDRFAGDLECLLALGPSRVADRTTYRAALAHGFAYYFWSWDPRALQHHPAVEQAIINWAAVDVPDLDLLCELLDFLFFVSWCFNESSTRQCQFAMRGMKAAAAAFGRTARQPSPPPAPDGPVHVVWLTMIASASEPRIAGGLCHIAPALLARPERFRLSVLAWRSAEPAFLEWLRDLGGTCHLVAASRPTELVQAIEALTAPDPPAIAISDMNIAVPTMLFARGLAPAQIFLQGGMPAWPVRPLHGVFNSFGFDPVVAGWGEARVLSFNPPWDLAKLNPPEDAEEVARQRACMPQGLRVIGNYSRLVKLTEPCLLAVQNILQRCPDVGFVTGGTGDASDIRAFIARSPVGERMRVVEGFVPGQSWGRSLEVYLDTWPVTGGGSCREMIAKGRPVVTMHSTEMPAIDLQRDPVLVARDWREYADIAVRLLQDPTEYAAACARAASLAMAMTDHASFAARLIADLETVLDDVCARPPQTDPPRRWPSVRRLLNWNKKV